MPRHAPRHHRIAKAIPTSHRQGVRISNARALSVTHSARAPPQCAPLAQENINASRRPLLHERDHSIFTRALSARHQFRRRCERGAFHCA
jgi:hypothetical protein